MIVCPLCSKEIPQDAEQCRTRCPMGKNCGLIRCPYCGYEMLPESRLVKLVRKWVGTK